MSLIIKELCVEIAGREVLHDIDMEINPGETHVLFGKNGSGKTSLLMAIMGLSGYRITNGSITFKGRDITHLPINERANLGIGMAFQRPPTIRDSKRETWWTFWGSKEATAERRRSTQKAWNSPNFSTGK